jgi:CBS domain-containing protein
MALFGSKKLKDIMTKGFESITPETDLKRAAELMRSLDVGFLPIVEGGRLKGVVTDRDITVRAIASGMDPTTTPVTSIMTDGVVCAYEEDSVEEAATLMKEKQIRRLLVLSEDRRVVGVVSLGDVAVDLGKDKLSGDVLKAVSEPSKPNR